MSVGTRSALDLNQVLRSLREHAGERRFHDFALDLQKLGMRNDLAIDLIWRLLSDGVIRFSHDRERIELVPDEPARKVAG